MKIWFPYVYAGTGADVYTLNLAEALRQHGVTVQVTCFAHAWQYFPWRLRLAKAPAGTDIILANSWNAFAFKRANAKLLVVEHLFVLDPALKPYRNAAQSLFHHLFVRHFLGNSYRAADQVIAISQYVAQQISKAFPAIRPHVILNGIDTRFFRPAKAGKVDLDKPRTLLFIGKPSRRKGADLLPKIMEKLGAGYQLLYTPGPSGEDPFAGQPRMRAIGRLSPEQARDAYQTADIFLFPSRLEGFGLVVAEALACGTPVVCTRSSSLPELVSDGSTGKLCAVDDIDCMVSAITRLCEDPTRLNACSVAARSDAEQRLSMDTMVENYLTLFKQLLANR